MENTLDTEVLKLYSKFVRYALKGFVKLKDDYNKTWYLGPEALAMLNNGVRLTTNEVRPIPIPEKESTSEL